MGERRMIKKERKPPTKKKVAAVVPKREPYPNQIPPLSCPNLSLATTRQRSWTIEQNLSGSGGTTKSWITSPSSCCIKQTWPQLVVSNICQEKIKIYYGWCTDIPIGFSTSNGSIVMTGMSSPAFAIRDRTNYRYRTRDCRVTEPYSCDGRYMEFTNVIRFQGKYYAISRQGCLALIEDEGSSVNFEITALGRNRAVPYCKESRHFREYMLVWENEIYLVFLLSRKSINVVDGVEVLQFDSTRLLWEQVDCLKDDAMFFLQDDRCMGISACLLGCSKGSNCVYFTHDRADDDSWFVYDMETSCISPTSGPEIDHPIPEFRR